MKNYANKVALSDSKGIRISGFYDAIDTITSEHFAIVTQKSGSKLLYNFLTFKGTLLSEEWFIRVEPFGKGDEATRVQRQNGRWNLLKKDGKFVMKQDKYAIRTQLRDGIAIVVNNLNDENYVNSSGTLLSKTWFYHANIFDKKGWAKVKTINGLYNYINKSGKLLLKRSADSFEKWEGFIIAYSQSKITMIKEEDYSITCEINSVDPESTVATDIGLFIKNQDYEVTIINKETGKPIFDNWMLSLRQLRYSDYIMSMEMSTKKGILEDVWLYYLYDKNGKKVTEQGFVTIRDENPYEQGYEVEIFKDGKIVEAWLNKETLEVKVRN